MGLFSCLGTLFGTKKFNDALTKAERQKNLAFVSIKIKELALQEFIAHFNTIFKPNIFIDNLELDIDTRVNNFSLYLNEQCEAYDKSRTLHHALEHFYFDEVQSLKNLLPKNATHTEPYVYKLIRNATEESYKKIEFSWTQIKEIRKLIKNIYKKRYDEHNATNASALELPSFILQHTLHPFAQLTPNEFGKMQKLLLPFTRDERWNTDPLFQQCQEKIFGLVGNEDYKQIQFTTEEKELWRKISLEYSEKKLPNDLLELPALHTLLLQKNSSEVRNIRTANYAIQILESLPSTQEDLYSKCVTLTQTLISSYGYSSVYAGKFAALVKQLSMEFFVSYTSIKNTNIPVTLYGTAQSKEANSSKVLWKIFSPEDIINGKIWYETFNESIHEEEECNSSIDPETSFDSQSEMSVNSDNLELRRVPPIDSDKEKALENTNDLTMKLCRIAKTEIDIQNSENPYKDTFNDIYTQATAQFARYFSGYPRFHIPQNANIYTLIEKLEEYCKANQAANSTSPFMNTDTYRLKTAQYAKQVLQSLLSLAASPVNEMPTLLTNIMLTMIQGHHTAQSHLSKFSRYIKGESGFASVISSTCKMFTQNQEVKRKVTHLMQEETKILPKLSVDPSFKRLNSLLQESSVTSKRNMASAA